MSTSDSSRILVVVARFLWWSGLILLLPSVVFFIAPKFVTDIFLKFPKEVAMPTSCDSERFLSVTIAGLTIWVILAIVKTIAYLREVNLKTEKEHGSFWRKLKTLLTFWLTAVVLCLALYAAILSFFSVALYEQTCIDNEGLLPCNMCRHN